MKYFTIMWKIFQWALHWIFNQTRILQISVGELSDWKHAQIVEKIQIKEIFAIDKAKICFSDCYTPPT